MMTDAVGVKLCSFSQAYLIQWAHVLYDTLSAATEESVTHASDVSFDWRFASCVLFSVTFKCRIPWPLR
jgi:hypothetical protein